MGKQLMPSLVATGIQKHGSTVSKISLAQLDAITRWLTPAEPPLVIFAGPLYFCCEIRWALLMHLGQRPPLFRARGFAIHRVSLMLYGIPLYSLFLVPNVVEMLMAQPLSR